jgi:hypothetical protein
MVKEEKPLPLSRGRELGIRVISLIAISCVILSGVKSISFSFKNSHEMHQDMELLSSAAHPALSISAKLQQDGKCHTSIRQ